MSEVIGNAITLIIFLLVSLFALVFLLDIWTAHSSGLQQGIDQQLERAETSITIVSAQATPLSCVTYSIEVINSGKTAISNFTQIDIFVKYTSFLGAPINERLEYDTDWGVSAISPDDRNPNQWDPGETATLLFNLQPAMQSLNTGAVVIVTPQGVSDSTYFTCAA